MIMRIFQVVTHPGKEAEFAEFFHHTAIPMMKATRGVVSVFPGTARLDSPRDFSLVMVWESLDALKAFVGEEYDSPHIAPAEADLVQFRTIKHYEFVAT
jgi:quinol monooxygenase YgiN